MCYITESIEGTEIELVVLIIGGDVSGYDGLRIHDEMHTQKLS